MCHHTRPIVDFSIDLCHGQVALSRGGRWPRLDDGDSLWVQAQLPFLSLYSGAQCTNTEVAEERLTDISRFYFVLLIITTSCGEQSHSTQSPFVSRLRGPSSDCPSRSSGNQSFVFQTLNYYPLHRNQCRPEFLLILPRKSKWKNVLLSTLSTGGLPSLLSFGILLEGVEMLQ
jgi:hypothetical protein